MLNTFKHRLDRIESEVGTENREDVEAGRRIMRAFLAWRCDQVGELYERRDQGDEKATVDLCQERDETKGMSREEEGAYYIDKINGLLRSGALDPYLEPEPEEAAG